jgi:hypothetical protein
VKCPRCKNEVAKLTQAPSTAPDWPEGLCDTCDAVERASDVPPLRKASKAPHYQWSTAPPEMVTTPLMADDPQPASGKRRGPYKKAPAEKPTRRYIRRSKPVSGGLNGESADCLEAYRERLQVELIEAEERVVKLRIKVEVANDILNEVQRKSD